MENIPAHARKGLFFPLILALAGLVFLLERNGLVDRQAVFQLMPLVVGVSLFVSRLRRQAGNGQ